MTSNNQIIIVDFPSSLFTIRSDLILHKKFVPFGPVAPLGPGYPDKPFGPMFPMKMRK